MRHSDPRLRQAGVQTRRKGTLDAPYTEVAPGPTCWPEQQYKAISIKTFRKPLLYHLHLCNKHPSAEQKKNNKKFNFTGARAARAPEKFLTSLGRAPVCFLSVSLSFAFQMHSNFRASGIGCVLQTVPCLVKGPSKVTLRRAWIYPEAGLHPF